jgi:hypothetical protein
VFAIGDQGLSRWDVKFVFGPKDDVAEAVRDIGAASVVQSHDVNLCHSEARIVRCDDRIASNCVP